MVFIQERLNAYVDVKEVLGDKYYCFRCKIRYTRKVIAPCPVCNKFTIVNLSKCRCVPQSFNYRREKQLLLFMGVQA